MINILTLNYWFLRHAKTNPVTNGQTDKDRIISDIGKQQALETYEELKDTSFDYILSSPAKRVQETVGYALGRKATEIKIIPALYCSGIDDLDAMFHQYMYAPLSTYFSDERAEALHIYGRNTAKIVEGELALAITANKETKKEINVLIAGHAVVLNSTIFYLGNYHLMPGSGSVEDNTGKNRCLETVLGEAKYLKFKLPLKV